MGKLVILGQDTKESGSRSNANRKASLFRPVEGTPFGTVKPAQAIVAVVIAMVCLFAAIRHFRDMGGDNELNRSQAQSQASHKRLALAGLTNGRGGAAADHGMETNR